MEAVRENRSSIVRPISLESRDDSMLAASRAGFSRLLPLVEAATRTALASRAVQRPLPTGNPRQVLAAAEAALGAPEIPREGVGNEAALARVVRVLSQYGLDLTHPHAAAHLQPPPLCIAAAADLLASASNASLDTYDSGPSAIAVERWLIRALVRLAGLGSSADGVLTPGGSMSNLLGLLLARDAAALERGIDVRRQGVARLPRPLVLCSELAHFSTHRACAALGLGEGAVRSIASDARRRMRLSELERVLRQASAEQTLIAIVATAGTTDFGSIDALPAIADLAAEYGVWLHVDAAYGFGALFSERLRPGLRGIERADSITLDLHKLGWQPAAASVLLVANSAAFGALEREVAYLNPDDDSALGLDGLLGRSLQTTRRPDAVKIVASLLAYGERGLGELVDRCHDLARYAEQRIVAEARLELVAPAELTTVVFRFRCARTSDADEVNAALRRQLLERGIAVIGRTRVRIVGAQPREQVCLKFTLLNPTATPSDIDRLLDAVVTAGCECESLVERVA